MPSVFRCLACVIFVGCGAVKDAADAGGDFTLLVSPASLEVPIAGEGMVALAVDRFGPVGDIALSAENVPAELDVTFAPTMLSSDATSAQIRVAVAGGSAATSTTITIVGTAGGARQTATLEVTSTTITVTGRIRGNRSGIPVRIVGKQPTTSDGTGAFTFTDVTPPYDLYTSGVEQVPSTSPAQAVFYYQGLTRPDPVVVAPEMLSVTPTELSHARITGTRTGGDTINERVIVWSTGGIDRGTAATYDIDASWPQAPSVTGTLYGLQWTKRANGAPDVFIGYATKNENLATGQPRTISLQMSAPATAALTGTVSPPAGFPAPSLELQQQFGSASATLWLSPATSVVATSIPLVSAGTSTLFAQTERATAEGSTSSSWAYPALTAATDVTFALPVPPSLMVPGANASGVSTSTRFEFSSAPSTVHVARLETTGAQRAIFLVYTTSTSFSLPAVPELPLPPGQAFTWSVTGYGPHASVDEIATPAGVRRPFAFRFDPVPPHFFTQSPRRTFTSAP